METKVNCIICAHYYHYMIDIFIACCTGFEYGLYYFITRGESYVAYLSNDDGDTIITKLFMPYSADYGEGVASGSGERNASRINHSFTELISSQKLYVVLGHCAYVAIGQEVIELILNAEPPYIVNRIQIGHKPTQIEAHGFGRMITLKVYYEDEDNSFKATYHKDKNRNWRLNTEGHQEVHDVTSRRKIITGEFVTVSSVLHYFCYIEAMQFGISCVHVEHAIAQQTIQNYTGTGIKVLPNTDSIMCSSYANCPVMHSQNGILVVIIRNCELNCETVSMIFNMSTLDNTANNYY